jgi:hypothetical protein
MPGLFNPYPTDGAEWRQKDVGTWVPGGGPQATTYQPTWRDSLSELIASGGQYAGMDSYDANKMGRNATSLLEWSPFAGDAVDVADVSTALGEGDWTDAAISSAGFLPIVGAGAKRGLKAAKEALGGADEVAEGASDLLARSFPEQRTKAWTAPEFTGSNLGYSVRPRTPLDQINPQYEPSSNPLVQSLPDPISYEDLKGKIVSPVVGDRSAAGVRLKGLLGMDFETPVDLHGGFQYPLAEKQKARNAVWASNDPEGIDRRQQRLREATDKDVVSWFTPMGLGAVDYSTMMGDTVTQMLRAAPPTREGQQAFDAAMRADWGKINKKTGKPDFPAIPDFPGISEITPEWIRKSGTDRKKLVQMMDSKNYADMGLADIAAARYAVTHPNLLDASTYAGGQSVFRLDPKGIIQPEDPSSTYKFDMTGQLLGSVPPVPMDILYGNQVKDWTNSAMSKKMLMNPPAIEMDNEVLDRIGTWQEGERPLMESGFFTRRDALAKQLADQERLSVKHPGIGGWHGSPHEFDEFKIAKMGTGEGAQAYGAGHYIAGAREVGEEYRKRLAGKPVPSQWQYRGGDVWNRHDAPDDVRRGAMELHKRMSIFKEPWKPELRGETRTNIEKTLKNIEEGHVQANAYDVEDLKAALRTLDDPDFNITEPVTPGRLYEVNIAADPEHLFDHDKPLHEQTPYVSERLGKLGFNTAPPSTDIEALRQRALEMTRLLEAPKDTSYWMRNDMDDLRAKIMEAQDPAAIHKATKNVGEDYGIFPKHILDMPTHRAHQMLSHTHKLEEHQPIIDALDFIRGEAEPRPRGRPLQFDMETRLGGRQQLAEAMSREGIPGIQFDDAGSRGKDDAAAKTKNYVVFDDKTLSIIKKYGIAGALGMGLISKEVADQYAAQEGKEM